MMFRNRNGLRGLVVVSLYGPDGDLKQRQEIENLITTAGDEYYAKRSGASVAPQNNPDVTKVTGMKLGTGAVLPSKSGSNSALGNYVTGSNISFMTGYPVYQQRPSDAGWDLLYYGQWAPGVATNSALTEAVIVKDSSTNATSTSANTISRVTFSAINKTAADTLEISWAHTFLGA